MELLARLIEADQPFYALHPHALDGRRAPDTVEEMAADYIRAIQTCQPLYPGRLVLLRALDDPRDPYKRWGGMSVGGLDVYEVPGSHFTMLMEPHVQQVAVQLTKLLCEAQHT